ncbi:MAG: hypothetical protein LBU32_05730 [Clostridiales bacterium]|jgi:hypothetical protein|nr:hypothetical protein [Clostridiales bacterium]
MNYAQCKVCFGKGNVWEDSLKGYVACEQCGGTGEDKRHLAKKCPGFKKPLGCRQIIVYAADDEKPPAFCPACQAKYEKAVEELARKPDEAKWKKKSCPGHGFFGCGNTIYYNIDWQNIPEFCPECDAIREEREAGSRGKKEGGKKRLPQSND